MPFFTGAGGWIYGSAALVLGLELCRQAVLVYKVREGMDANKKAMGLFGFTILYLFALFGILVVEHGFGLIGRWGL